MWLRISENEWINLEMVAYIAFTNQGWIDFYFAFTDERGWKPRATAKGVYAQRAEDWLNSAVIPGTIDAGLRVGRIAG